MKRIWLFPVAFSLGVLSIVFAAVAASLAGIHIPMGARLVLLAVGSAVLVGAMDGMGILPIRKHITAHLQTYRLAARYTAFSASGLLVLAAYIFFISVGRWTRWPPTTDYYDRLATAFRAGHLYMNEAPPPALLALPDPYDLDARNSTPGLHTDQLDAIWDMSLYQDRIYLYWGPAPALLLDGLQLVYPGVIGDPQLSLAFVLGLFVFQSLILVRLWRRFFAALPAWTAVAGILLAGFLSPAPWLLFSPRIYEAAIAAGQFFLVGGVFFVFSGLNRDTASRWRVCLAAGLWVCAVGSRATLAIPVAFLAFMVLLWLLRMPSRAGVPSARLISAAAFAVPLLLGASLLGWYNFARFGSGFEFGFRYAITMLNQNKNYSILFSPIYLGPNSYLYLFNAPSLDAGFPFVRPVWNESLVTAFNSSIHGIYNAERIIGLVFVAPFLFFAVVSPILALVAWSRGREKGAALAKSSLDEERSRFLRWFIFTLGGAALLGLLTVFLVFYATMRYSMDVTPTLLILAMLGFWEGYRSLGNRRFWRLTLAAIAAALIMVSIVMSVLIGFSSDVSRIRAANPALLTHIKLFFMALTRHMGQ